MKAIDVLKICAFGLELLSKSDIKAADYKYIPLYEEYLQLRKDGHKYEYAVTILSDKYKISQSSVSRLIRRFGKDCHVLTGGKS